ncbi:MAG: deoxyribodipyrimidine photolyase, partial [bacterium]|nr:deoxyribodipyrimidine photolyase [bacterium]
MPVVPDIRLFVHRDMPPRAEGHYVLYWMRTNRRVTYNFSLQRAVWWARRLARPLVVVDILPLDYPWASERLHAFAMEGMTDLGEKLDPSAARYDPVIEKKSGEGCALLCALAQNACVVVTDEYPTRFFRRQLSESFSGMNLRIEAVDSCGLLPLRAAERVFPTAYAFRRFLQKNLPSHLNHPPVKSPLDGVSLPP